jgi:actin-related protein
MKLSPFTNDFKQSSITSKLVEAFRLEKAEKAKIAKLTEVEKLKRKVDKELKSKIAKDIKNYLANQQKEIANKLKSKIAKAKSVRAYLVNQQNKIKTTKFKVSDGSSETAKTTKSIDRSGLYENQQHQIYSILESGGFLPDSLQKHMLQIEIWNSVYNYDEL